MKLVETKVLTEWEPFVVLDPDLASVIPRWEVEQAEFGGDLQPLKAVHVSRQSEASDGDTNISKHIQQQSRSQLWIHHDQINYSGHADRDWAVLKMWTPSPYVVVCQNKQLLAGWF